MGRDVASTLALMISPCPWLPGRPILAPVLAQWNRPRPSTLSHVRLQIITREMLVPGVYTSGHPWHYEVMRENEMETRKAGCWLCDETINPDETEDYTLCSECERKETEAEINATRKMW